MNRQIHAIIASDSRAKNFLQETCPNTDDYVTHNIICRGAKIDRIASAISNKLRKLPQDVFVIIKICAGINELTFKLSHDNGTELVPNQNQNLLQHILQLKEHIRKVRPFSLVGFATIPIVNLAQAKIYYLEKGWLKKSMFDDFQTKEQQEQLTKTLATINSRLTKENTINQYIPGHGVVLPTQCYLHQDIEKYSIRRRGNRKRIRKHIQISALPDGVHPSDRIASKWFHCIHTNLKRESLRVRNPSNINGEITTF